MSKQFYNYLENKLVKFLENNQIKAGERFYIQLDEKNQVVDFYKVLKENVKAEEFLYKHEQGDTYKSFYLKLKGVNLVVASTINVTEAYLVRIRNASGEQLGIWENTALLILSDSPNDSIKGGCLDLRKEGMPFSINSISGSLNKDIEESDLSKVDKEVVKFYMKQKLEDSYNNSLWDYEEILSIINKSKVEEEDYAKIGLFIDSTLEKETPKSIQKRLKENFDLFSKIESYQEYEDKEQYLEKIFDDKGIDKLKKDNWREIDFKVVKRSFEENKKNKPLGYIERREKYIEGNTIFWERPKGDTASGRRKRHIIVFNNGESKTLEINFEFDDTLSNDYIESKSKKYAHATGKKLKVRIPSDSENSNFYKIVYKHKNETKSKYEFFIVIVNTKPEYLKGIKASYEVKTGSGAKNRIQVNSDGSEIKFGYGINEKKVEIENIDDIVNISESDIIKISNSSPAWGDESLKFRMNFNGNIIPFEIKEQGLGKKHINSVNLLKLKREFKSDFIWEENKLTQETREFYLDEKLKAILGKEKELVEKAIMHGRENLKEIEEIEVVYSNELTKVYNEILDYYRIKGNIPSLTYLDEEIIEIYERYLEIYNNEIETISEREIIFNNTTKKDLLKIGTIIGEGKIMLTPFSPVNVAYILELYKQLQDEVIEGNILERLSANNLIPYMYNNNDEIYKPSYQRDNLEWIIFEKKEKVSIGETNAFIAKVVKEKIEQFISNFNYLFPKNSVAPIKINVINIKNDDEIVRGVFEYIKKQIVNNPNNIIPIDVTIYNEGIESAFDRFFKIISIEGLENEFNISFNTKNNQLDEADVMRLALENIRYFKKADDEYRYAHISFYKSIDDNRIAEDNTKSIESGISIGGLLSTVTSNNNENDYRIGFGTKNIIDEKNILIRTAININEFTTNCKNEGVNPYRKANSIVTRPVILKKVIREKLYTSSHWVTFIEPSFGLEYFKESENLDLIVVHYSDQYSSTEQYDTITVTNKSNQYKHIIKEFLDKKSIGVDDNKLNAVIKSFNSINGEWLLSMIGNKSEYDREKLSIISAVKYGLSLLNHEDIIWIPISMEEILRVSSAVKLSKSEGIFSIKNLKKKGVHSDDLIFIGLNIKDKENIKVYYYPVEVKIGYNFESVIDKGIVQIDKTHNLLKEQLCSGFDGERKAFKNKFFRNFFIKLLISNAQKFIINDIWPEKEFSRINEVKKYLLNDDYEVSLELNKYIGKGALISFKKDNYWRSIKKEDDILFIELTEKDAYEGIARTVNELYEDIKRGNNDISLDELLYYKDINNSYEKDVDYKEF